MKQPSNEASAAARLLAARRKTYGAGSGRLRSHARRCGCGVMTLKRAQARGHTIGASTGLRVVPKVEAPRSA